MEHSPNSLFDLIERNLKAQLADLEVARSPVKRKYIQGLAGAILLGLLIILVGTKVIPQTLLAYALILLTFLFTTNRFSRYNSEYSCYQKLYKKTIVRELLTHISPEWQYFPEKHMPQKDYHDSKLFWHQYDRFKGDDLVIGHFDQTAFSCSELIVRVVQNGRKTKAFTTIFRGLFFRADFHQKISSETIVLPSKEPNSFNRNINRLPQNANKPFSQVKMADPTFESLFKVISTDHQVARHLLTPKLMEAMVKLRERHDHHMYFSFIDDHLYSAICFDDPLFEPIIFRSVIDFEEIRFIADLFEFNRLLVQELNLNNRIWTEA